MPVEEVLIVAVTHMLSGLCIAGFSREPAPVTGLRWVRPVKAHDSLLLGDLADVAGRVIEPGDVVALDLGRAVPQPPHVEDCVCDWLHQRPRLLRRLEGERRARFLREHLDRAPADVLENRSRSLCLVKPQQVWAHFSLDRYSGKYRARLGFGMDGARHAQGNSEDGVPVTDLRWRALGRAWLGPEGGELSLDQETLLTRLQAQEIYLTLGLSRGYRDQFWLLVVGVHCVPDYKITVDYGRP